jgi:biopolymer transport protein ExbD/biopolymer transport protein TolR
MAARQLKIRKTKLPEPEINVTPLVDVVLVLLIIFMVVTPAMAEGEHIELPKLTAVDEKPKDLHPIELTLALNGRILIEKNPVAEADVLPKLKELHKADGEKQLRLNADARLPWGRIRSMMAKVQDVGFSGVSIKVEEQSSGTSQKKKGEK